MRVAVLATGGKDSALALHRVLNQGYQVTCLVSMIPLREDSWMFHYPNIRLVNLFAEAAKLPLVEGETSGVKEKEVDDLKNLLEKIDVEGIVSGAIASNYQKDRIDGVCKQIGLECISPLWQEDPLGLLKEVLSLKFDVIFTGVYAYGFDKTWLGRRIDAQSVADLMVLNRKYGISLVGEGGEYETFVLDAPFFDKRINIVGAEKVWKNQSGYYQITEARVESKE